ncbi:pimeloyl-ACP methyl ester esterase BioH [Echinimonas agarilytica]|uniref:Pimeloyl-[acyl-carrier protein] methyl ester esterase n=1 Tax=Echinimonas agarilytica TaxID=1215918 RepID=A0AA42B888_9GAMM|nr:pimeloyl-ACP methyl ester esterase BioH [Echinimonas agarilytica]MCM2680905.1 pimeloyl-ACP methyl ester esterase BioH [Echinimonas agarilytica]
MAVSRVGTGPNLVLLHGWGMNSAVFQELVDALQQQYCCSLIDLPGFGDQPECEAASSIDAWLEQLLPQLPERAIWLGWSLGGLLVQRAAQCYPERIIGQLLVASSPYFQAVTQQSWRGIKPEVLALFAEQLSHDPNQTIERFLAIQAMGSETLKSDIKSLRAQVLSKPSPSQSALADGLSFLAKVDYRNVDTLSQPPAAWLLGRKDGLVPKALATWLREYRPHQPVTVFAASSHAPFISQLGDTVDWIVDASTGFDTE